MDRAKIFLKQFLPLAVVMALNAVVLVYAHNRTWVPHDDGYPAYVAERLLDGAVLGRDVETRHGGYHHFVNAFAMKCFGRTLAAMRYPLALLALIQSVLVYFLFLSGGVLLASAASAVITVFSFPQFPNPTANWYALFLVFGILSVLKFWRGRALAGLAVIGFLLGLIFLFRQLSAVFVGMGLAVYLLLQGEGREGNAPLAARCVLGVCLAVLVLYLIESSDWVNFILIGAAPLLVLVLAAWRAREENQSTLLILAMIALGALVSALPLMIYLVTHGAFLIWMSDMVERAPNLITIMPFQAWSNYFYYGVIGLKQVFEHKTFHTVVNGIYWTLLPLVPLGAGALTVHYVFFAKRVSGREKALPIVSVFYALVSHLLQIHIYLYYSLGLSLLSLLWMAGTYSKKFKWGMTALCASLVIVNLYYHAAQPALRGFWGIVEGKRETLVNPRPLDKMGVRIGEKDRLTYARLLSLIESETSINDSILAIPNHPEIYYLSGRKNPFRFTLLPMAVQSDGDLANFSDALFVSRPKLVIHDFKDKYNLPALEPVTREIQSRYDSIARIGGFEIYRRKD